MVKTNGGNLPDHGSRESNPSLAELNVAALEARIAALEKNQERLLVFINSVNGVVWEAYADPFKFTFVSAYAERLLGYPVSEWLDSPTFWSDHIYPQDRDAAIRYCENFTKRELDHQFEYRMVASDGRCVWIRDSVSVSRENDRIKLSGVMMDVTENKNLVEALGRSEKRARAVFDQTFEFIGLLDTAGVVQEANLSALAFAGIGIDQVVGKPFWETPWWAHSADEQARLREAISSALEGNFARFETSHLSHDGTLHTIDFSLKPVFDGNGKVEWLIPEGRDITAQKHAEQERERALAAQKENQESNLSVLDSLSDQVVVLDPQGCIISVNKAWQQFAKRNVADASAGNYIGINYLAFCASEKDSRLDGSVLEGIKKVLNNETSSFNVEIPYQSAANEERWFHMNVTRLVGEKAGAVIRLSNITDSKKSEKAVRSAKEFSQSILDGLNQMICVLDTTGNILAVNKSWKTYAIKSGTLLERASEGRNYLAICDTALGRDTLPAARFANGIREVMQGEQSSFKQEYFSAGLKGSLQRILIGNVSRFTGSQNSYIIISHEDVTELRAVEMELREAEKRLALALESTNDAIWDLDVKSGKIIQNKRYYTMLGYNYGEIDITHDMWRSLVHPEDILRVKEIALAYDEGRTDFYEVEFRMRRKDGDWCWILSRGRVVQRDKKGMPLRMVGTHSDITARKQAEAFLQQSESRLRSVLNTIVEGVLMIDKSGIIHLINAAACKLFFYEEQELLGQNVELLMPSPHKENHAGYIRRYLDSGEPKIIGKGLELLAVRKDGSKIPIFLRVGVVNLKGEAYFTGVIRDLSTEKLAENIRLDMEKRLMHSQKLESMGALASGIAHDFNNMLSSILGYTELARSKTTDTNVLRALDKAVAASLRARELIKQILTFSRSGKVQLQSLDFIPIINEVLEQIHPNVPENVLLEREISPPQCWLTGDASQLQQLILNLLTNAIQAMPKGGKLFLGLAIEQLEKPDPILNLKSGPYACLTVKDTGEGMSDDVLSRIFDPFFSTKGSKGTGLGLSVVHGIVKTHGGSISVDSSEGKGSTFKVLLPVSSAEHS